MSWDILFGAVGALAVLVPAALVVARRLRRLSQFLEDWFGEQARPGVRHRPGVMERLATVEERTEQLQRNGGSSLRDAVDRTEGLARRAVSDVAELRARSDVDGR